MLGWILSILFSLIAHSATAATMRDLADCNNLDRPEQQIPACTRLIEDKATPDDERFMATYHRAVAYENQRVYEQALADYTEVLKHRPIALVYANRGWVYQQLNRLQNSLDDLNEAIQLDPNEQRPYMVRGVTLANMNQFVRAITDFNHAQELNPNDNETYWQRARTYEVMRYFKPALEDYNAYLEREPKSVRGLISRARIFLALDDLDRALADANEAMVIEPSNPWALTVRGNIYRTKRDSRRAIDDYTAAIHFNGYSEFYHERGVAYRMMGDKEKAIDDFKMAVHLQPTMSQASRDELKSMGIDMADYDPMKLPKASDMLNTLKRP